MNPLTAIAVDDEPKALEIIERYSDKVPFMELKATFRDALEAISWIQKNEVDLIFLDINMPHLSGLKFRSLIGEQAMIIFTTAYSEYALESYEMNAVDYLLKPIVFERFLKAVLKAKERLKSPSVVMPPSSSPQTNNHHIYVKSGNKHFKLRTDDILYLEKDGNYVFFHTKEKKVMSRLSMQQVEELLPESTFLKVHKSYVIGLQHIEVLEPHQVVIGAVKIPVAKPYRKTLMEQIKKLEP